MFLRSQRTVAGRRDEGVSKCPTLTSSWPTWNFLSIHSCIHTMPNYVQYSVVLGGHLYGYSMKVLVSNTLHALLVRVSFYLSQFSFASYYHLLYLISNWSLISEFRTKNGRATGQTAHHRAFPLWIYDEGCNHVRIVKWVRWGFEDFVRLALRLKNHHSSSLWVP